MIRLRVKKYFYLLLGLVLLLPQPLFAATSTGVIPNDTFFSKQWYLRQIDAMDAWSVTTGTPSVVVAVIDGGVDINHQELKGNIWTNPKEVAGDGIDNDRDGFIDDVHGWNFVTDSGDVRPVFAPVQEEDAWSHGTIVSSLIAAHGNDGIGIAGVAWNVKIMPLVVLDAEGAGSVGDVVGAIRYAVSHGANIINLSLVGYEDDLTLDQTIQNAANAGVLVVAANGNDDENKQGINLDVTPAYPVCSAMSTRLIIGVGGTDTLDQKAPYSNYGRSCTDISAPAQLFFAARPSYPHNPGRATSTVPGYIDGITGTSLAAPLVSGVAALIKSVRPLWTAAQIRERILDTADSIESGVLPHTKGVLGFGRLNAGRALQGLGATTSTTAIKPAHKK